MSAKVESHTAVFGVLVLAALGVLLAACNYRFTGCQRDELVAPVITSPSFDAVLDGLTPTLAWTYEGDCEPDSFRLRLSSSHEWPVAITGEVGSDTTWWTPPVALEPAMSYAWSVFAVSRSTEGLRANGNFRTGPLCTSTDPADYAAPVLMSPTDGYALELAYITFSDGTREPTVSIRFVWDDPSACMPPEGYHVEVATSRRFGPETLVDEFTTTHHRGHFFFAPGIEWRQCANYFWRVTTILPGGTYGPTSDTWSFITPNVSGLACLEVLPAVVEMVPVGRGTSAIAGHVWHDECAVPYETTDDVPSGCVRTPDGGLEANGVLDPDEVGIGGVTVQLGSGPCPVADGQSYVTDVNGYYSFSLLPAGTYCVAIDAMDEDNIGVLLPGWWTVPYRWYGPGPVEVELSLGEADIQRYNDFGWDHQFLPSPSGAITPTPPMASPIPPMAIPIQNINCRSGPGSLYDVRTSILTGVELPIVGRNQEGTWWAVQAAGLIAHCWVWGELVEVEGDVQAVPFLAAPLLPSPTPVQGCWVYNPQQQLVCTVPCPQNAQPGGACTP